MGHLLKNTVFKNGSYALGVPVGSSTIGPEIPVIGQTRYNTSTSKLEFYNSSVWNAVAKEGNVTITKDSLTGDNIVSDFTMTKTYTSGQEAQVLVFLNTVFQNPGVNYTFNGTTNIHFTSVPGMSAVILVLHNIASTTV
ncbi:MAG: hypothetical protein WCQ44_01045 [Opitutaceae bacterium]